MTRITIVPLIAFAVFLLSALAARAQDGKVRIYIIDSQSWQVSGAAGASIDGGGGSISGGARPQTTEIMKTFAERCPICTITLNRDRADYVVRLDHEGGKSLFLKDNKVAVFNQDGDMIYSGSTRSLGNAVKDACAALERDRLNKP